MTTQVEVRSDQDKQSVELGSTARVSEVSELSKTQHGFAYVLGFEQPEGRAYAALTGKGWRVYPHVTKRLAAKDWGVLDGWVQGTHDHSRSTYKKPVSLMEVFCHPTAGTCVLVHYSKA